MFEFNGVKITSNISIFKVFVEKREYDIAGVLVNDTYGFLIPFEGIGQMFYRLDQLFDFVDFPTANRKERSFMKERPRKEHTIPSAVRSLAEEEEIPEQPNFILHVEFRRGTTWQGTLNWIGHEQVRRFRSEQELLRLMLSALDWDAESEDAVVGEGLRLK